MNNSSDIWNVYGTILFYRNFISRKQNSSNFETNTKFKKKLSFISNTYNQNNQYNYNIYICTNN